MSNLYFVKMSDLRVFNKRSVDAQLNQNLYFDRFEVTVRALMKKKRIKLKLDDVKIPLRILFSTKDSRGNYSRIETISPPSLVDVLEADAMYIMLSPVDARQRTSRAA